MTHRSFTDREGNRWEVWDVYPIRTERRMATRRRVAEGGTLVERRHVADRRQQKQARATLGQDFNGGWLCFERDDQRRRLAPVPRGWEEWDETRLDLCCRAAVPVVRRVMG